MHKITRIRKFPVDNNPYLCLLPIKAKVQEPKWFAKLIPIFLDKFQKELDHKGHNIDSLQVWYDFHGIPEYFQDHFECLSEFVQHSSNKSHKYQNCLSSWHIKMQNLLEMYKNVKRFFNLWMRKCSRGKFKIAYIYIFNFVPNFLHPKDEGVCRNLKILHSILYPIFIHTLNIFRAIIGQISTGKFLWIYKLIQEIAIEIWLNLLKRFAKWLNVFKDIF